MTRHLRIALAVGAILGLTAGIELAMGRTCRSDRTAVSACGKATSGAASSRSGSPIPTRSPTSCTACCSTGCSGSRRGGLPLRHRFLAAVLLEAGWEVLENSPLIIDRYRAVTISLGYVGDSVLNSVSDVLMMSLGFLLASRWRVWASVAFVVAWRSVCFSGCATT